MADVNDVDWAAIDWPFIVGRIVATVDDCCGCNMTRGLSVNEALAVELAAKAIRERGDG